MSDRHCIRRLRLTLGTDYPRAAGLTERTRRLFHQRIRSLLDKLLKQASLQGHVLKAEQIVIDLGDLPEAHFEEAFCQRLMHILPEKLYQQWRDEFAGMNPSEPGEMIRPVMLDNGQIPDSERSAAGARHHGRFNHSASARNIRHPPCILRKHRSDNCQIRAGLSVSEPEGRMYGDETEKSSSFCRRVVVHYLRTAIWARELSPDSWLAEQLTQHPDFLNSLAEICLQMPRMSLPGRFFRESTLRGLIRKLAPGKFEHQPISPGSVLFAALYWYECHSAVPVPAFPQRIDWPVLPFSDAESESLPPLTRPELAPWSRALYDTSLSMPSLSDEDDKDLVSGPPDAFIQRHATEAEEKTAPSRAEKVTPLSASASAMPVRTFPEKDGCVSPVSAVHFPERKGGYQHVSGAGLSLLWPLLPELLQITGIRQQDAVMDEDQRLDAVKLLAYLVAGEVCETLPCTLFSHWLCGVSPEHTQTIVPLSAERAEKVEQWLQTLPERIPGWQRLSGQDIRMLFLQREGWLYHDSNTLYLPPQPADILLAQWPWPLTILLLPWLQTPLTLSLSLPPQK